MKRIMSCASLLILALCHAFAGDSEIFPLSGITLGMSARELLEKYPTEEILFAEETENKTIEQGMAFYEIPANSYWDTLCVGIDQAKVESLQYFYANKEMLLQKWNHDKMIENLQPIFKQLKRQLGMAFEKKIIYIEEKTRCAMYVWKRETDVVGFSHSPVSKYKKGSAFYCNLTIAPTIETLESLRPIATDRVPEDAALWADAMGEEKTGAWLFLVIGVLVVIGAILAWCCFRKRNK